MDLRIIDEARPVAPGERVELRGDVGVAALVERLCRGRCVPHHLQNFRNSMRSGVFRLLFIVW